MALEHWLKLALTEGLGPILTRRLIEKAGGPEAAADAAIPLLRTVDGIGMKSADKIAAALRVAGEDVPKVTAATEKAGARIICPEDDEFPPLLNDIPDPPAVLFVRGRIEPRDLNGIAIVGSRKCSLYGREQAERFGALLAGAGCTVVSGGARGIDSAAHRGAMQPTNGRTIAVLGCGVDIAYPPENQSLFAQIAQQGAVISEHAPGTPPVAEHFPRRNRLISGISRGVLVVEADVRSGALITARQAIDDHGRTVLALPGRVDNPMSAGPHQLIRDGATLVTSLDDILESLPPLSQTVREPALFTEPAADEAPASRPASVSEGDLPDHQAAILQALSDTELDADGIINATALPASVVMQELTMMSLRGLIRRVDGVRFAARRR